MKQTILVSFLPSFLLSFFIHSLLRFAVTSLRWSEKFGILAQILISIETFFRIITIFPRVACIVIPFIAITSWSIDRHHRRMRFFLPHEPSFVRNGTFTRTFLFLFQCKFLRDFVLLPLALIRQTIRGNCFGWTLNRDVETRCFISLWNFGEILGGRNNRIGIFRKFHRQGWRALCHRHRFACDHIRHALLQISLGDASSSSLPLSLSPLRQILPGGGSRLGSRSTFTRPLWLSL